MKKMFFILLVLMAEQGHAQDVRLKKDDLKELADRMSGIFSNSEQSAKDSNYHSNILHIKPIWQTRADGYWFYVEQASIQNLQKPYQQSVYHIYQQDNYTMVSKVYELRNPDQYVTAWKDDNKLYQLTEDVLIDRQGCAIDLYKNKEGDFIGTTQGKECLSTLHGATYTTSEITIYKDKLLIWDRGWDANGKQVWGAEKGGNIFIKSKD